MDMKKQTGLKPPSRVDQVGMIVRDAARAAEHFSRFYGIGPWYRAEFTDKEIFYRGRRVGLDAEILIGFCGGVEIELIQMNNDEETIYSDILRKQAGGVHHMGFFVRRYDDMVAAMKDRGVEPLQWGYLKTRAAR
jgi:4-hydroxyphenylpyruvate dioxygenase-like putative hemolysin